MNLYTAIYKFLCNCLLELAHFSVAILLAYRCHKMENSISYAYYTFKNTLSNQKHSCVVLQGAMPTHTESRNPLSGVREKSLSVYFLAFRQADKFFFLPSSYSPDFFS